MNQTIKFIKKEIELLQEQLPKKRITSESLIVMNKIKKLENKLKNLLSVGGKKE